ncbi:hypothetical protein MRX96_027017 [Rhipicephalus microplus]
MAVRVEYTSCSCNRNPQSLDWGCNNIVAYGACNAVVLYDPEANDGGAGAVTHTLVNHSAKVNCVRWIRRKNGAETALLSTSVDKTLQALVETFPIRIWEVDAEFTARCVQEINLKGNFAMDIRMCFLPSTCAGFVKCHTLYGHEDWVRGITFKECADDSVFVASCTTLNESSQAFDVELETVLSGHEGWVYSVHWCPATSRGEDGGERHSLLSASMDKTIVVWEPDSSTGLWLDKARFGDIGGKHIRLSRGRVRS